MNETKLDIKSDEAVAQIIDMFVSWAEEDKYEKYPISMQKKIGSIINPIILKVQKNIGKGTKYSYQSAESFLRNTAKKMKNSKNEIERIFADMILSDRDNLMSAADAIAEEI